MSTVIVFDAPANALPSAKSMIEPIMTGLRPKTSASAPDNGKKAVLDSAYAEPTQLKSSPPLRAEVIVGRAVATAVRSRALRKIEVRTATKDSQNEELFLPRQWGLRELSWDMVWSSSRLAFQKARRCDIYESLLRMRCLPCKPSW